MVQKLKWKQHTNAQALLNEVYNESKDSVSTDPELAERVQFMWYNLNTNKYEVIYFAEIIE